MLSYWNGFLKKDGYVAVTDASWFTDERPAEIEKFWTDMGCVLNTVGHNILIMQRCGYVPAAAFILPEYCWTENYFVPRTAAEQSFEEKHIGNKIVEEYIESSKCEVELYSKYKQYYGYAFYIGRKL